MISSSTLILLPLWVLLSGFIGCILFWKMPKYQIGIAVAFLSLYLGSGVLLLGSVYQEGIQVVQIGNWPAPYGITLVADLLAAMMVLISGIVAFAIVFYSFQNISAKRKRFGFYPALLCMMFGVCGSFLTGDIFNLYVWFEVMLLASFVLIVLGNRKPQLEGAVKYVILSFISSGFLLTGIGIIYRLTGTLNMADLSLAIKNHPDQELITLSSIFFLMGFGIKAAIFPLFSWLPASYPTPPVAISGLMAGLLTKVGVYAMIRFWTLLFIHHIALSHTILLIIAGFTMIIGVFGAVAQSDFRKILSFHIISQIGYMIMGLALFTPLALAGAIFYIIHHILVKTNLFLISGIIKTTHGFYKLKKLGSAYQKFPFITVLFVISAFSLAGIPPLSGFWGKFMLAKAGLETDAYIIVIISLFVGFLTLFSMTKIWKHVFWKTAPAKQLKSISYAEKSFIKDKIWLVLPSVFLTICTLILSFYPEWTLSLAQEAALQLLNTDLYVNAVLHK